MLAEVGAIPDWERAHGAPVAAVSIRHTANDFQVTEELGFEPSADGEHDFLWIEKIDANTEWVARQLARHANVSSRDVGFAGLKDRNALTRQWFSVRRPSRDGTDWRSLAVEGVHVLDIARNARKLRRGAHRSNVFRIALRGEDMDASAAALHERIDRIGKAGIPNYFGEQRFGRDGGNLNLAKAMFGGKRLRRDARSFALSAARSFLFNTILDQRVRDGSWNAMLQGDLANLDGTGSVFAVDEVTSELETRCREFDIHPSATLWGDGAPLTTRDAAELENAAVADYTELTEGLKNARVEAASRPLRVQVQNLSVQISENVTWLEFRLPKGAFATALLREIVSYSI
ncbi:MAG: tRNA pseudouridine(13) synthase TruD [Gammaproteobacteria bacterium]|nr:tRNA pseudouridine(13) synthase TruD [Gammaproteobacteria bacterium]